MVLKNKILSKTLCLNIWLLMNNQDVIFAESMLLKCRQEMLQIAYYKTNIDEAF